MLRERITRVLEQDPHPEAEHEGIICIIYKPKAKTVRLECAMGPESTVTLKNVEGISTQEETVVAEIDGRADEFTVCAGKDEFNFFDGYMDYGDGIFKFWKPRYGRIIE